MAAFSVVKSPDLLVDGRPEGSACCVWADAAGRTYVISAAHVVGDRPEGTVLMWFGVNGEIGAGVTLAPTLYWKRVAGGDLDAGPVLIREAGPFAFAPSFPWGAPIHPVVTMRDREPVAICGKWGLVFATYEGPEAPGREFNDHLHGRLLRFRYDPAQSQPDPAHDMTEPGDSGAPIVSMFDGALLAVHVARAMLDDGRFSLGVPAEDVVAAFDQDLPGFRLVSP